MVHDNFCIQNCRVYQVGVTLFLDDAVAADLHMRWTDGTANGKDTLVAGLQMMGEHEQPFPFLGDFADGTGAGDLLKVQGIKNG